MATKTIRTRIVVLLAFLVAPLLLTSCNWYQEILPSWWTDVQNELLNGSFEDGTGPDGPFNPNQNPIHRGFMSINPGETTIPNWTVTTGPPGVEVAWAQNDNGPIANATPYGSHFLDLTGVNDCPRCGGHFGGVMQQFPTAIDFRYHLSFKMGLYGTAYHGPIWVVASLSGPNGENPSPPLKCGDFNWTDRGPGWLGCDFDFFARSAMTTLTITGYGPENEITQPTVYIGLDSVSVQCWAPLGRHFLCTNNILGL